MGFFSKHGGKHNLEADSSSGRRPTNFTIAPRPSRQRERLYLPVHRCRYFWKHRIPAPYPDVNLPHG